jgi:hypothetical protein
MIDKGIGFNLDIILRFYWGGCLEPSALGVIA